MPPMLPPQPSAEEIQASLLAAQARVLGRVTSKTDRLDNIVDNVMRRAELGEHRAAELVFRLIGLGAKTAEPPAITVNQHGEQNQAIIGAPRPQQQLDNEGNEVEVIEVEPKQLTDMHAIERQQKKRAKKRERAS